MGKVITVWRGGVKPEMWFRMGNSDTSLKSGSQSVVPDQHHLGN